MGNPLQDYMLGVGDAGGRTNGLKQVLEWTPVAYPSLAKEFGGFQLGINAPLSQLPAGDFIAGTMLTAWSVIPGEAKSQMVDAIRSIAEGFNLGSVALDGTVGNVLSGVMEGIGSSIAYVEAMNELAKAIVGYGEQVRETNDQRRYEGRLACVELLMEAGPNTWAGDNYFDARYSRKRVGKSSVSNMVWPPDVGRGLQTNPPIRRSGNCRDGGSDLSPRGSSCKGSFTLFPIYMPLWGNRALGNPGVTWSMTRGMERADEGGARIWKLMSQMQGDLLMDPMINLLCDARTVYWNMQNFIQSQFGPALNHAIKRTDGHAITIDKEFNPDNAGVGFYYTPGQMIGTYTNTGRGSLSDPALDKILLAPDETGASSFGGNGIRISDFNNVLSTTAQFLSLRTATLRSRAFCQRAVDEGIVDMMPEKAGRAAVRASAEGQPAVPLGATSTGPVKRATLIFDVGEGGGVTGVGGRLTAPPKKKKKSKPPTFLDRYGKPIGGAVVLAVAGGLVYRRMKKKR